MSLFFISFNIENGFVRYMNLIISDDQRWQFGVNGAIIYIRNVEEKEKKGGGRLNYKCLDHLDLKIIHSRMNDLIS